MPASTLEPQPLLSRITNKDGYTFVGGIERGMVFWGEVRHGEHRDSEHFHENPNPCPWVILSRNDLHRRLPIAVAVPLSSKLDKEKGDFRNFRIRVPSNTITRYELRPGSYPLGEGDSLALTEQIRVFAHDRIVGDGPIAMLPIAVLASIEAGAKFVLDFA